MIVPSPQRRRSGADNMLPLINVVFLLLIFFVIAGAITRDAPFDLMLPSTSRVDNKAVPKDKILSMAADGRLAFAGKLIEPRDVGVVLSDWPQDEPLQIRADSGLPAGQLVELLETLRAAGLNNVRLLTKHESR